MTKILLFGEDPNDTRALKELILGLCPALARSDVRELRKPPTLQRGAHGELVKSWAQRAARVTSAANLALGAAVCVLAHTDADGPDDGTFERRRTRELREAGVSHAHAVVPIEAIEAWWLLFPEATESIVPSWSGCLARHRVHVDGITDPKAELIRQTRDRQPRRPYRERDSPKIAEAIVTSGGLVGRRGRSGSFDRFVAVVGKCCEQIS